MIIRFFILLIGFGLAVSGGVSLIAYLNLLTADYTLAYYFAFIFFRIEFYLFLVGFILVFISIYFPSSYK